MAKISSVNNLVGTGAEAIFILKETLKTAGWTVPKSSDGTTYNAIGDEITHEGEGAGGMENNYAWFVIESPNGEHQWCFQKETGGDNQEWRVKISSLDGFTGGSPSATQVPSATDEQVIHGSGSDAAPVMADLFLTDGAYRFSVIAENAAVGTAVPIYPFWAMAVQNTTSNVNTFFGQEALKPGTFPELSSGTRAAPVTGDPDPCVYLCDYWGSGTCYLLQWNDSGGAWNDSASDCKAWYKMNYAGEEAFVSMPGHVYYTSTSSGRILAPYKGAVTSGMAVNPYNGADDGVPFAMGRGSGFGSSIGYKGFSNHVKLRTLNKSWPSTINLSSDAYVYAGAVLIPWENGTAPL